MIVALTPTNVAMQLTSSRALYEYTTEKKKEVLSSLAGNKKCAKGDRRMWVCIILYS